MLYYSRWPIIKLWQWPCRYLFTVFTPLKFEPLWLWPLFTVYPLNKRKHFHYFKPTEKRQMRRNFVVFVTGWLRFYFHSNHYNIFFFYQIKNRLGALSQLWLARAELHTRPHVINPHSHWLPTRFSYPFLTRVLSGSQLVSLFLRE